jgi:hypothetical protein
MLIEMQKNEELAVEGEEQQKEIMNSFVHKSWSPMRKDSNVVMEKKEKL